MTSIWTLLGRAVRRGLPLVLVALLGFASVGCGAMAALTNPKAAWALDEGAPMSVVVRRAEVAQATADQVDRLMTETALDDESAWVGQTALKKEEAEALLKELASKDDTYKGQPGAKLRVVPAEAWVKSFSAICSDEEAYPSLLAAASPALDASYGEIRKLQAEITKLKTAIAAEESALDKDGLSDEVKAGHEKKIEELEASIEKLEEQIEPKKEAFLAKVSEEGAKADEATKKRIAIAVVNLRRAVEDAKLNNSVALLRYPMAMTSLPDDVQSTAKRVVADVIEERTGKRPDMTTLKPEVKLEGGDVKLSLNGLSPSDLASLSPDEVIEETTLRLGGYVGRVMTLPGIVDDSQDRLTFQGDVLDAWMAAMKLDPAGVQNAGDDLGEITVEATGAPQPPNPNVKPRTIDTSKVVLGKFSPAGVRAMSCKAKGKKEPNVEEPEAEEVAAAEKPGKGAKDPKATAAKSKTAAASKPSAPAKSAAASPKPASPAPAGGPTLPAKGSAAAAPAAPPPGNCDLEVTTSVGSSCL